MTIGKISGPMLRSNLERQDVDLAIDTNLALFNVGERIVAINTANVYSKFDPNLTYYSNPRLVVNGEILSNSFVGVWSADPSNSESVVDISATGAVVIPTGNTAQRPVSPEYGSLRFNTETNGMEVYTLNDIWQGVARAVTGETFQGDGTTSEFTANASLIGGDDLNDESAIVSINGVIQLPSIAYTVSNNVIVFNEIPSSTDVIHVRYVLTQLTPVTTGFISTQELKNIVSNAASFTEFQAIVANI